MSNRELVQRMEINERELATIRACLSLLRDHQKKLDELACPLTADETAALLERLEAVPLEELGE